MHAQSQPASFCLNNLVFSCGPATFEFHRQTMQQMPKSLLKSNRNLTVWARIMIKLHQFTPFKAVDLDHFSMWIPNLESKHLQKT